jgi:hypothetical protein
MAKDMGKALEELAELAALMDRVLMATEASTI